MCAQRASALADKCLAISTVRGGGGGTEQRNKSKNKLGFPPGHRNLTTKYKTVYSLDKVKKKIL